MKYSNCFRCGYFRDEETHYYCNDLDCTVDPYEPACNYE